jgi:hypothetical protein
MIPTRICHGRTLNPVLVAPLKQKKKKAFTARPKTNGADRKFQAKRTDIQDLRKGERVKKLGK